MLQFSHVPLLELFLLDCLCSWDLLLQTGLASSCLCWTVCSPGSAVPDWSAHPRMLSGGVLRGAHLLGCFHAPSKSGAPCSAFQLLPSWTLAPSVDPLWLLATPCPSPGVLVASTVSCWPLHHSGLRFKMDPKNKKLHHHRL